MFTARKALWFLPTELCPVSKLNDLMKTDECKHDRRRALEEDVGGHNENEIKVFPTRYTNTQNTVNNSNGMRTCFRLAHILMTTSSPTEDDGGNIIKMVSKTLTNMISKVQEIFAQSSWFRISLLVCVSSNVFDNSEPNHSAYRRRWR